MCAVRVGDTQGLNTNGVFLVNCILMNIQSCFFLGAGQLESIYIVKHDISMCVGSAYRQAESNKNPVFSSDTCLKMSHFQFSS